MILTSTVPEEANVSVPLFWKVWRETDVVVEGVPMFSEKIVVGPPPPEGLIVSTSVFESEPEPLVAVMVTFEVPATVSVPR